MRRLVLIALLGAGLAGCSDEDIPSGSGGVTTVVPDAATYPDAGPEVPAEPEEGERPTDGPLVGLSPAALDAFDRGNKLFDGKFSVSAGLGPLFIRPACGDCHDKATNGPGFVQKFQIADAATGAPITDAPELAFGGTERPFTAAGAVTPLLAPVTARPGQVVVLSRRVGPSVMGRGYIEAILDSEIERVAAEQARRTDGISGRINRVTYHSRALPGVALPHGYQERGLIGRFGVKARVATLDDFTADAFQGDMGLTSPMRPEELANPDGLLDDEKVGLDVTAEQVLTVAAYVRTVDIPSRGEAASNSAGREAFEAASCSVCHVPGLRTRADYPVLQLADFYAPVYTDLLLHDMGEALADGQTDEGAERREWRTAPLIGLRFQSSYLHDGRAATVEAAILKHAGPGSEANDSVEKFKALPREQRAALVAFVRGL